MRKTLFDRLRHGRKMAAKGHDKPQASRRTWLKHIAIMTAAASMPSLPEAAVAAPASEAKKVTKESVHYQDRPNAGKMCGMCKFFIPQGGVAGHGMMGGMMGPEMMAGGTCQLVEGNISPMGYCILYTPA